MMATLFCSHSPGQLPINEEIASTTSKGCSVTVQLSERTDLSSHVMKSQQPRPKIAQGMSVVIVPCP